MKWIEEQLIAEYGFDRWRRMDEREKLMLIASFGKNLVGAIAYINKETRKENEYYAV